MRGGEKREELEVINDYVVVCNLKSPAPMNFHDSRLSLDLLHLTSKFQVLLLPMFDHSRIFFSIQSI